MLIRIRFPGLGVSQHCVDGEKNVFFFIFIQLFNLDHPIKKFSILYSFGFAILRREIVDADIVDVGYFLNHVDGRCHIAFFIAAKDGRDNP